MSTWLYLECLDHDPPLCSADEVGQHLSDLPDIRRMIADRDTLTRVAAEYDVIPDGYFAAATVRFLRQHPHCRLRIVDEYNQEHPLTTEDTPVSDWHDDGTRTPIGMNLNPPAYGFGNCPICDKPIRTADSIIATKTGRFVHAACEADREPTISELRATINESSMQLTDALTKLAAIIGPLPEPTDD